jgi:putative membrane protein
VMDWYDHDMGWWGYTGMAIGIVLILILLIGGIVAAVGFVGDTQRTRKQPAVVQPPTAEQILSARYAHGEITATEYLERLTVLRKASPSQPDLAAPRD